MEAPETAPDENSPKQQIGNKRFTVGQLVRIATILVLAAAVVVLLAIASLT